MKTRTTWKTIICLTSLSLCGILSFYWSCSVNYFNCQNRKHVASMLGDVYSLKIDRKKSRKLQSRHDARDEGGNEVLADLPNVLVHAPIPDVTYTSINESVIVDSIHTKPNKFINQFVKVNSSIPKTNYKQSNSKSTMPLPTVNHTEKFPTSKEHHKHRNKKKFRRTKLLLKDVPNTGIYIFPNISCKALHPDALLYNRIFKTASSSFSEYMRDISSSMNYTVDLATTEDWYKTGNSFPYPGIIERHVRRSTKRFAFIAHFYFRPDLDIVRAFTYINMVREPITRIISHYRYMRTEMRPKHRVIEMKRSGQWNESLTDCVTYEHRGCESNVMTRFFCGTAPFCKTGSKKALKVAKLNVKRYYAAIGLQEHILLYLQVLKKRLPGYFAFENNVALPNVKQNSSNKFKNISLHTLGLLRERNVADIKLYKFLTTRFWIQVKRCGKLDRK